MSGDARAKSDERTAVEECRLLFLRTAAEHPLIRLSDTLRKEVGEPCEMLWAALGLPVPNRPALEYTPQQWQASRTFEQELSRLTRDWALEHNLCFDWVLRHASSMATRWFNYPKSRAFGEVIGYEPPEFVFEPWFMHESEVTYRKQTMTKFRHTLDAHIRDVKELRSRFLKDRGSQAVHYRWAVERICLGWTWDYIAKVNGASVTYQAARKAVLPILERIGIPETKPKRREK
jgi:hypothetical protein